MVLNVPRASIVSRVHTSVLEIPNFVWALAPDWADVTEPDVECPYLHKDTKPQTDSGKSGDRHTSSPLVLTFPFERNFVVLSTCKQKRVGAFIWLVIQPYTFFSSPVDIVPYYIQRCYSKRQKKRKV